MEVSSEGELTTGEKLRDYSTDLRDAITQGDAKADDKRTVRIWSATYACTVAALGFLVLGYSLGYNSPVSSHLKHKKGYASLRRTLDQDLFAFSFLIGSTILTPFSGYLTDRFGRKLSIVLCCIPHTFGWLIVVLTVSTDGPAFRPLLYIGRFIVGVAFGWSSLCLTLYVAELSPSHYRSAFVSLNQVSLIVGMFAAQVIGVYITYYWLAIIPLVFMAVYVPFVITIKETPRWLLTQSRKSEAAKVLMWLNGPQSNVGKEIQEIEEEISVGKLSLLEIVREFKFKSIYHPVILACFVMCFLQLSGITAIIFNVEDIFKQAKVKSPGLTSSFATGGVQILTAFIGVFVASLLGRRKLLIISYSVASLSHAVMGVYEYLNNEPYCHPPDDPQCKSDLYPLAIVCVALYVAAYSSGISPASFLLLAELVPLRVRGVGIGLALLVNGMLSAIIAGLFNSFEVAVKPWGVFWTFSITCFIGILFVAIFLPETKGKSLEEIESYFDNRRLGYRQIYSIQ